MKTGPADSLHLPAGFLFSAATAGIKASGRPDLAYAEAPGGASAAAVFTRNRVVAAPLEVGKAHLRSSGGRVRAVVVNAGNANCATGPEGRRACAEVCRQTARLLKMAPREVFPASTGIIGVPLPVHKITAALPGLIAAKEASAPALLRFAHAIMTTDTRPKIASARFPAGHKVVTLAGVAKGAGMIHPNLATMLVYLFTDLAARPAELRPLLRAACDDSFNCISVDGDTSTNDTVLLLASGASGVELRQAGVRQLVAAALAAVCRSLAEQILADGEGVKHVVSLHIEGARSREEARSIARAIANSSLVKTAWAGADPNWGRILAAIGNSGVPVDPRRVTIRFGDQVVCRRGAACAFDRLAAHEYLSQPGYEIRIQLGQGHTRLRFLTGDLTTDYVHINADYST
jgi:glutamate N-acetyltransferase/amino-acid N-acetyltransferase